MAGPGPSRPAGAHGAHPIHIHPVRPLYRFAATGLGASMWFFVSCSAFLVYAPCLTDPPVDVQSQEGISTPAPGTTSHINLTQRTALLSSAGSTHGTTKALAQSAIFFFNASRVSNVYITIPIPPSMAFQTSSGTRPTPLHHYTRTTLHTQDRRFASGGTMSRSSPSHMSPPDAARALVCSCSWLIASPALVSLLSLPPELLILLPRMFARSSCH